MVCNVKNVCFTSDAYTSTYMHQLNKTKIKTHAWLSRQDDLVVKTDFPKARVELNYRSMVNPVCLTDLSHAASFLLGLKWS